MLSRDDRHAIQDLFRRLAEAERNGGPRDPEAETLIRDLMSRQPSAAYYLAQTVVAQQQALQAGDRRMADLQAQVNRHDERQEAPQVAPGQPRQGGFLDNAAQTAAGVAGGLMLGSLIGSIFSHGDGQPADHQQDHADPGGDADDGGDNDGGGGEADGGGGEF